MVVLVSCTFLLVVVCVGRRHVEVAVSGGVVVGRDLVAQCFRHDSGKW